MPRKSPYSILLTQEEKEILEKEVTKYTSPYYKVIRCKIILYAAQGFDNNQISSRLDLPRQIVSKWRKRFFQGRLTSLEDEPRKGRPLVFSP